MQPSAPSPGAACRAVESSVAGGPPVPLRERPTARRKTAALKKRDMARGARALVWLCCMAACGSGPSQLPYAACEGALSGRIAAMRLRGAGAGAEVASGLGSAARETPAKGGAGGLCEGVQETCDDGPAVCSDVTSDGATLAGLRGRSHRPGQRAARDLVEQGQQLCSSTTGSPIVRCLDNNRKVYLPWVLDGPSVQQEGSRSPSPRAERLASSSASGADAAGAPEVQGGRQRTDEIFKPTPFSAWANDAVRIRMVRNASDLREAARQFQPLFTHQVFGGKEEIIGFENPVVQIIYAANTLRPCICFGAAEKVERQLLKEHGLQRTRVLDCIRTYAPSDYAASTQEVLDEASRAASNRPIGEVIWKYASRNHGDADLAFGALVSEPGGGHGSGADGARSEFRLYRTGLASEEAQVVLRRVQSLAIWLIERASYIRADDNWELLMLYEHVGALQARNGPGCERDEGDDLELDTDTDEQAQFVGFVTLYKDYNLIKSKGSSSKSASSASANSPSSGAIDRDDTEVGDGDEGRAEEAGARKFRLRISQFVIVPPYQRRGHGEQVLRAIYSLGRGMPDCVEVCVETPSPGFGRLRDKTDARVLQELGYFDHMQAPNPDWNALATALKWPRTQLRHLHASVVRKVVKSLHTQRPDGSFAADRSRHLLGGGVSADEGSLCEVDGQSYCAGDFAMVRGPDEKRLLAQLLGINPSTRLLRVRWVYQWEDVAPEAMMQSSSRWRALLAPGVRRKPSSVQQQGEVFFVFHEDFIHHQALVEKATVRFIQPEGSGPMVDELLAPGAGRASEQGAAARRSFVCRFVYDPGEFLHRFARNG